MAQTISEEVIRALSVHLQLGEQIRYYIVGISGLWISDSQSLQAKVNKPISHHLCCPGK